MTENAENTKIGSGWDYMLSALIKWTQSKTSPIYDGRCEFEAIEKILTIPEIQELTSNWISLLSQDNNISLQNSNDNRKRGNSFYKSADYMLMDAVNCYTRAIFTAPKENEALGMAYANRAAALMKLGYHKEAYSDCKMVASTKYPKSTLFKVLWRQACCSIELKEVKQLEKDLIQMNDLVNELNIRHLHVNALKKLSIQHGKLKEELHASKKSNESRAPTSTIKKKLIEKQSSRRGRFAMTTEPILTDEYIVKEKAFAFVPVYQKFDRDPIDVHCHNCAATNIIPYPCLSCRRASYCGLSCLREHKEIHQFECNGYKRHLWYEIGITHLAVRTMLCGIDELLKQIYHFRNTSPLVVWNEMLLIIDETHFTYGRVLKLVTNFEKTKRDDFLGYVLTATMITMYLRNHTSFFQELANRYPRFMTCTEWEQFIGAIIARHIGQLICNGHAISDFEIKNFAAFTSPVCLTKGQLFQSIESQRIFTAIFPRISIFNHSCDPNIRNRFNNNELIIYATRFINNGDEILNCYGPNHQIMSCKERKALLKQQYHFKCICSSCKGTDDDYLNSRIYLCKCGADVHIAKKNLWWRDATMKDLPKGIICSNCSFPMKFDWVVKFRKVMEEWDIQCHPYTEKCTTGFIKVIAEYENACRFLKGDYNLHKMDMSNMVLKYLVRIPSEASCRFTDEINEHYDRIRNICLSLLRGYEYQFGRHSLEYLSIVAALMDINAICGRSSDDVIDGINFDCLSDRTRNIFLKYYENYKTIVEQ